MSFSMIPSPSSFHILSGEIPGFDQIPSDVMGLIAEYAECMGEAEDRPLWNIYRNEECFRALFEPRLNEERLKVVHLAYKQLNTEYALYQNYRKVVNCWEISKWLLLCNHSTALHANLQEIAKDRVFYSSPTLQQYWLKYLDSLHHAFLAGNPPDHLAHLSQDILNADEHALLTLAGVDIHAPSHADPRVNDILAACNILEQGFGAFPTQRLRDMIQSTQKTFYFDIASHGVQNARNVRVRSVIKKALACAVCVCKKALACAVYVCLIARRILSEIFPLDFWKAVVKGTVKCSVYVIIIVVSDMLCGNERGRLEFLKFLFSGISRVNIAIAITGMAAIYHLSLRLYVISSTIGIAWAWRELEKDDLKCMIRYIKHVWHARDLITDLYIEGAAAHISIATESMRRLGPIRGLRHGCRMLSRIVAK